MTEVTSFQKSEYAHIAHMNITNKSEKYIRRGNNDIFINIIRGCNRSISEVINQGRY